MVGSQISSHQKRSVLESKCNLLICGGVDSNSVDILKIASPYVFGDNWSEYLQNNSGRRLSKKIEVNNSIFGWNDVNVFAEARISPAGGRHYPASPYQERRWASF